MKTLSFSLFRQPAVFLAVLLAACGAPPAASEAPKASAVQSAVQTDSKENVYRQIHAAAARRDYAAVFALLKPLAEQGDAESQNNLAVLHQDGLGVEKNDKTALQWYERAAAQGLAEAQFNAGLMHAQGKGTAQDFARAAAWYQKAAEQNHAEAQNNLAVRYASGSGVARDLKRAEHWFARAAANGHPTAAAALQQLKQLNN